MTPTREQIEAARYTMDMLLDAMQSGHALTITSEEREALRTLLAATAEPTEQELADEAERAWSSMRLRLATLREFRAIYIAGARREGRK